MRLKIPKTPDETKWHIWYAWHPVIIEDKDGSTHVVWCEEIERKRTGYDEWKYRFIKVKEEDVGSNTDGGSSSRENDRHEA